MLSVKNQSDINDYLNSLQNTGVITLNEKMQICNAIQSRAKSIYATNSNIDDCTTQAFNELLNTGKIPNGDKLAKTSIKNKIIPKQKENEPDFDTLKQYIDFGFTLIACKPYRHTETKNGVEQWKTDYIPCDWSKKKDIQGRLDFPTASKKNNNTETKYIHSIDELKQAIDKGIYNFHFLPSEKGFLCIDIDKGHANEVDGIKLFNDFFREKNIAYDFFNESAVYADTPSGGIHLYFNAEWAKIDKYLTNFINENKYIGNIEIRGAGNQKDLTAAGSIKNGRSYILHGKLKDAPQLPNMLIKYITPKPNELKTTKDNNNSKGYSISKLIDLVFKDYKGLGRNNTAYQIGYRVGSQYNIESIIQECYTRPLFSDFSESELRTALNSGIKNSKY